MWLCIYFEYVIVMVDFDSCFASFWFLSCRFLSSSIHFSFLFLSLSLFLSSLWILLLAFDHGKKTQIRTHIWNVCVCVELSLFRSITTARITWYQIYWHWPCITIFYVGSRWSTVPTDCHGKYAACLLYAAIRYKKAKKRLPTHFDGTNTALKTKKK